MESGEKLTKLYQWDVYQTIRIYGADMTEIPSVQFGTWCGSEAYSATPVIKSNYLEVQIPNEVLERPGPIFGYLCYQNGTDGKYTRTGFMIPVVSKAEPDVKYRAGRRTTTSGDPAVVSISDADPILRSAVIHFTNKRGGSGTASPDNIRPITGHRSFSLYSAGKILSDDATMQEGGIGSGGTISFDPSNPSYHSSIIPVSGISLVVVHWPLGTGAFSASVHAYNADGNWVRKLTDYNYTGDSGNTWLTCNTSGVSHIRVSSTVSSGPVVADADNISIDITGLGSFGYAYRGTYNVVSGLLTLTHAFKEFDGTETWKRIAGSSGNPHYFYYGVGDYGSGVNDSEICSHWPHVTIASSNSAVGARTLSSNSGGSNFRLAIRPENATSLNVTTFKAFVKEQYDNGTPLQALWKLKTPVTYELTPKTIEVPDGTKLIWSGNGSIDVTYTKDLETYLDELREASAHD